MIELIIKQPDPLCLDCDIRINGETLHAKDISIYMATEEHIEVTSTFLIDKLNIVAGYEEVRKESQ